MSAGMSAGTSAEEWARSGSPSTGRRAPSHRRGRQLSAWLRDDLGLTGTKVGCDSGRLRGLHRAGQRSTGVRMHGARRPPRRCAGRHGGASRHAPRRSGAAALVRPPRCGAVRVLHPWHVDQRLPTAVRGPPSQRGAGSGHAGRCAVPLHRVPLDHRRRRGGQRRARRRGLLGLRGPRSAAAAKTVGARLIRVDATEKVTGTDRFGDDGIPPEALTVTVIRSPFHRAGFRLGDLAAWAADVADADTVDVIDRGRHSRRGRRGRRGRGRRDRRDHRRRRAGPQRLRGHPRLRRPAGLRRGRDSPPGGGDRRGRQPRPAAPTAALALTVPGDLGRAAQQWARWPRPRPRQVAAGPR